MKKEKYKLWPQFGPRAYSHYWANRRKAIKGYVCQDCGIVIEDEPELSKPHFTRWYGQGLVSHNSVYLCSECRRPLKVRTLISIVKPPCVCGHPYQPAHSQWGRHSCGLCDCCEYRTAKDLAYKHIAHKYLATINGDFRGCVSNGQWALIVTEKGHAFFKELRT